MAKNNYDPAHEGELAARRDAYRMSKAADKIAELTDTERHQIAKVIQNLQAAGRALHIVLAKDNHGKLTEGDKENLIRFDAYDSATIAVNQMKNLL